MGICIYIFVCIWNLCSKIVFSLRAAAVSIASLWLSCLVPCLVCLRPNLTSQLWRSLQVVRQVSAVIQLNYFHKSGYCISANSFLLWKICSFNSFRGNYSKYEVKNCHNAETIWKFPHFWLSKKNSFQGNYLQKYGMYEKFLVLVILFRPNLFLFQYYKTLK